MYYKKALLIGLVAGAAVCIALRLGGNVGKAIFIIVMCVAIFAGKNLKEGEERRHILNKGGKTAILYQRSAFSSSVFRIQRVHKVHYDFEPSKLVYTGATVGGITTGGLHTTQAHYKEVSEGTSGKAMLIAKFSDGETETIEIIHLANEKLVAEAANDPRVSRFLKGNDLVLKYSDEKSELTDDEKYVLKKAIAENNTAMQRYITQRAFLATQLTTEECKNIKRWIRGK